MKDLKIKVTDMLHRLGVPASLKGYNFVREGIVMMIQTPSVVSRITKVLYLEIAKKYDTTPSRVERAIRHAVEVSFERGDCEYIQYVFGYTVSSHKGKPTNTEFMAMIADRIRLEAECNAEH